MAKRGHCAGSLRFSKTSGLCVSEKKPFHPPSLPGIAGVTRLRWAPEAKKLCGRRRRSTQTAVAAVGLSAATELDWAVCGPLGVCGTLSVARGDPALVLCQHAQKCLLLPRLRPGR